VVDDALNAEPPPPETPAPTATDISAIVSDSAGAHDAGHHDLLDPVVLAAQTELAGAGLSPEERLKQAFPGAEEV